MSELRDELEKNFASADLQSKENNMVNSTESNEDEQALDHREIIAAPKSYTKQFQENFKLLSPEWQKYLTERERQIEKGFSDMGNKINAGKWADRFFDERKERLENLGFKSAEDYIGKLILLDDAMQESPEQILNYLAKTYGIEQKNNNALRSLNEQKFLSDLAQYERAFQKRQSDAAFFDVSRFEEAVNDNGQLKHPFVKDVKAQMIGALKGGEAKTLEEAYQKALWLNEQTRDKMIEDKINNVLSQKFEEAFKAKEISFSPHSKETAQPKELSLREELEAQFRKEF
ncbi:MAG: hypothetical protein IJ870_02575 [Alphaproteobacteria bacterium]|nr:hypothetical protein [Alphaproteobacteria bacterium]